MGVVRMASIRTCRTIATCSRELVSLATMSARVAFGVFKTCVWHWSEVLVLILRTP